jgi:hypothetical protein
MKPEAPFLILCARGRPGIQFTAHTQPKEIIKLLGDPTRSWDDGTDHCLVYSTDSFDLEFLWDVVHVVGIRRLRFRYADLDFSEAHPTFHSESEQRAKIGEQDVTPNA